MLPSIPSENSGGLDSTRSLRSTERTQQALARAPQEADGGEAERARRVDGAELSVRGEHLADATRRGAGRPVHQREPRREGDASADGRESAEPTLDDTSRSDGTNAVATTAAPLVAEPRFAREEVRELRDLQRADRRTRVAEYVQRQLAAGQVRGVPEFRYEQGPDGRRYAVNADSDFESPRPGTDPRRAAREAASVRRAALAGPNASPGERAEAARASSAEARARAEIARQVGESTDAARREAAEAYERSREDLRPSDDGGASRAA